MNYIHQLATKVIKFALKSIKSVLAKSSWHKTLQENNWAYINEPQHCTTTQHNFPTYGISPGSRSTSGCKKDDLCQCGAITYDDFNKQLLKQKILK